MDSCLVITYFLTNGRRAFKAKYEPGRTYSILQGKLAESSAIYFYEDPDWSHWVFENWQDEQGFLESFKWFIIHE